MTRKLHRKEKVALQYDERFGAIECILFVSGDPVPVIQLQRALGLTDIEMQSTLQSMDELYRRGDRAEYRIVIHQGKKRQIRRMCAAVGLTVTRLCRIAEGGLELGALPPGRWRYLTAGELESIKGSD